MAGPLLNRRTRRAIESIYKKVDSLSSSCLEKDECLNSCCTHDVPMMYVEFAYLIDFLNKKLPEKQVKEMLAKEPVPQELSMTGGKYCLILGENGCMAYPARPYRCRIYIRDEEGGLCRPLKTSEVDYSPYGPWMKLAALNLGSGIPDELTEVEKDIGFWTNTFLDI